MASRQTAGHHQLSPLSFRCRHSSVNRIVRRRASFIIASVRFFLKSRVRRPRKAERTSSLSGWEAASPAGAPSTATAWGFSCLRRGLPRRHRGCRSGGAFPRGCRRTIRTAGGAKKSNGSKLGNAGKRPRRRGRLQRPLRGAFLACGAGCLAGTGAAAAAARFRVGAGGRSARLGAPKSRMDRSSGTLGSGLAGGGAFNGHCVGLFLLAARAASPAQGLPQRRVSAWVPTFYCKFR